MFHFLSFSFLLLFFFLFEQSVLLPLGLSPGGFFVSFLVFIAGLFFLADDARWWFVLCGSVVAGVFSAMPFFLFLLFVFGGALFLLIKPFLSVERIFSFLSALWLGAALYVFVFSFLWGSSWMLGFAGAPAVFSFRLFFARAAVFAVWALVPASVLWWLVAYWRRDRQFYALKR